MCSLSHLGAEKAAWRKTLRARLASLDEGAAREAAARIRERVLSLPEVEAANGILVCLSFGHEVDTWGLVEGLLESGRQVFVPRVELRGERRLHVHPYPCELETLDFGLQQPRRGEPELAEGTIEGALDVALVVGLGFDRRGYRLGYGRGYFDRFLAGRSVVAIGLSYALQLVDRLPAGPRDVPMHLLVTELGVLRFAGTGGPGLR